MCANITFSTSNAWWFVSLVVFSKLLYWIAEGNKEACFVGQANFTTRVRHEAFPATPRFQYYDPQIFCLGFVFRVRVAFAFLARLNFKVKKLFVGAILTRKLTLPHSHGIREECWDHIRNLTPFWTPRVTHCFGIVFASRFLAKLSRFASFCKPTLGTKSGERPTINEMERTIVTAIVFFR